jgi:tetratricopeptide (TPR) repeat protein/DNA-binding winged helix-turn-helix (wHTH) protein
MQVFTKPSYRIANLEVSTEQNCLRRDGFEQYLRPKSFQVLIYLLENRQRVVTKDELIKTIWNDAAVTDDTLVQCLIEIRKALGDKSRNPRFVKTIPKIGYRFIGVVEEFLPTQATLQTEEITTLQIEIETTIDKAPTDKQIPNSLLDASPLRRFIPASRWQLVLVGLTAVLLLVAAGFSVQRWRRSQVRNPTEINLQQIVGRKPVAVMHFENQSGSRDLDWLREGLADMLITNLSRSNKLTLLSRGQLHLLLERMEHKRADAIDLGEAMEVARKSQAEVFILGSFSKINEQIRINAQIHDGRTGGLIAAEGFTADTSDQLLAQVDSLSIKIASHLGVTRNDREVKPEIALGMTNNLDAYRYYSLALEQTQMFQFPEAIELLEKAIALDTQFAMAYARIGYVYAVRWAQGDKAKPYFTKATELGDRLSNKERLFITAWSAQANYDSDTAIQTYKNLLEQYPLEIEAYQRLGWLLLYQERFDEALEVLKQGAVIDPDAKDFYNAMGDAYLMLSRAEESQAAFERYIQLAPQDPNAYDSLGTFYQWFGRYDEAVATYNRALAINPESTVAIIHLGHTYFQQGQYRAALEQYQRLAQVAKNDAVRARASECMAKVYLQKGDLQRATVAAKQTVQLNRLNNTAVLHSAWARGDKAAAEGLKRDAMASLSYAQLKQGGLLRFYYNLSGAIALQEGRTIEALDHFKETIRHRPLNWYIDSFEDSLANTHLRLGQFDEAIAEYQRILRINPNYPLAHYHLAQAFEGKGEPIKARESYQKFLQVWHRADIDIPQVISAKARLQALL